MAAYRKTFEGEVYLPGVGRVRGILYGDFDRYCPQYLERIEDEMAEVKMLTEVPEVPNLPVLNGNSEPQPKVEEQKKPRGRPKLIRD